MNISVASQCTASGLPTVAVNDTHKLFPHADILYANDEAWWTEHSGATSFKGERWSSHSLQPGPKGVNQNDKLACAKRWGLYLVEGRYDPGFSFQPTHINYGDNSGFQAINIAILLGARRILLVGFNMGVKKAKNKDVIYHFFGRHPQTLRNVDPSRFIPKFNEAAARLNGKVKIVNCTEDSLLECFPKQKLETALCEP